MYKHTEMSKPLGSFEDKKTNFDAITSEIKSKNIMKEIEEVIEGKRQEIFDILSDSIVDCKIPEFKESLEKMQEALNKKKDDLEKDLGEVTTNLNLLKDDNSDLIKYCKSILPTKSSAGTPDTKLAGECRNLLSYLQDVYTKGKGKNEVLFSGKKNSASEDFDDLLKPDTFEEIMNSKDEATLQSKIDEFVKKTFSPRDNSFGITKSKLYTSPVEQGKVAARIAIFLHCMQKALNEGKITKTKATELKSILKQLKEKQIPKIRSIYNLKKEKDAVDAELATLVDLEKNDNTEIQWTDTTTHIDLTDFFESKSTDRAKNIDFYNLSKKDIKINISGTEYTEDDIILKDSGGEKTELNIDAGSPSGDFDLYVKISGNEVKIGKINIDYTDKAKGSFTLIQDPDVIKNLTTALGTAITGDVNLSIPVMAVKKVSKPVKGTGQVSLTRNIVAKIKAGGGSPVPPPPPPGPGGTFDVEASLSNVTEVSREEAERVAEEQLRERYANLPRYSPDRINLFLRRDYIKEKYVRKIMNSEKGFSWKDRDVNATDRQQIQNSQDKIFDDEIETIDVQTKCPNTYTQIDNLCKSFTGTAPTFLSTMTEPVFQKRFADIINADPPYDRPSIVEVIGKERALTYSSNILMRLNMFVNHQRMVNDINTYIAAGHTDAEIDTYCRTEIKKYMDKYNDMPNFLKSIGTTLEDTNLGATLRGSTGALTTIAAQTMNLKMKIMKKGSAAYKIKQKRGFIANTGDVIDSGFAKKRKKEMPLRLLETCGWARGIARTGAVVGAGILGGLVGGPLGTALATGTAVGLRTLFSKYSHYTKEHEGQMKNEAVDRANYEAERSRLRTLISGKKWHERLGLRGKDRKDVRHRNRYVRTTHGRSENTLKLSSDITAIANRDAALNTAERTQLENLVAEGFARLKYYKETGQNFLGSDDVNKAEEDYRYLYSQLITGAKRLGWMDATNPNKVDEATIMGHANYTTTMNSLKSGYDQAKKRFKGKRAALGRGNAVVTGAIAGGLSYLTTKFGRGHKYGEGDEHNFSTPGDHLATDPMVHAEQGGGTNSLHDVFQNAMSDPSNAHATGYKLVVSPEVDSIPTGAASSHNFTSLSSKISSISVPTDPDSAAAFNKAMTLRANREHIPFYKRSPLEKALAFAKNHGADTGNQYLFGERFAETVSKTLQARVDSGMTSVPIDDIVFGRSAANAAESVAGSAGNLAERSMNGVLIIKKPGLGAGIPISRNTFKRHEGKVKPTSTATP